MSSTILIVDEDKAQLKIAEQIISEKLKYKTIAISCGQEAISLVNSSNSVINLMLLDMREAAALQVIETIKSYKPDFPIIIITEYGYHKNAVEAIHAGANDFLIKPFVVERLGLSIASSLRICNLCKVIEKLEKRLMKQSEYNGNVGSIPEVSFDAFNPSPFSRDGKVKKLRALEEDAIIFALNFCGGSMSKASRSLGIGRSTLYRKVSEMERHQAVSSYISRENQTTRPTIVSSEIEHS